MAASETRVIQAEAASKGIVAACHRGCDFCCHRVVAATLPEVIEVTEEVQARFTPDEKAALLKRCEEYEEATKGYWRLESQLANAPCPFLVDHDCSIYDSRPLSCHSRNSTNPESCRKAFIEGIGSPEGIIEGQADIASLGRDVLGACRDAGLASGIYDLGPAVREMLRQDRLPSLERVKTVSEYTRDEMPMHPVLRAIRNNPETAEILELRDAGNAEEVWRRLDRYKGTPFETVYRHTIPHQYETTEQLENWWQRWGEALDHFEKADLPSQDVFELLQGFNSFSLAYLGKDIKPYAQRFMRVANRHASVALPEMTCPIDQPRRPGKKRLGFISYRIQNFNGSKWSLGWLLNLSPDIETFVINLTEAEDHVSRCFRRNADHYYHMPFIVSQVAPFVRNLDLDALIFTDIGMCGFTTQLAALRLARHQYNAWGHPVTSGSPTMDYYLSSALMEPQNGQDFYTEQLIRLPGSGLTYQQPLLSPSQKTHAELGVPEDGFLLFCQLNMKQIPAYDHLFEEIGRRSKKPIVFLGAPPVVKGDTLRKRIEKPGLNFKFLPFQRQPDYWRILQLADASLDTPPWNGGNTTIEALCVGTPVVSLPGEFMRGRHSLAFLPQAGVPGLIAKDAADYVELALDADRQREAMKSLDVEGIFNDKSPAKAISEIVLNLPE